MPKKFVSHPLLCWDIASQASFRKRNYYDIVQFRELLKKAEWNFALTSIVSQDFDAIVVTDPSEVISWVSHGFQHMTGYSPRNVIGRKPSFLQGFKTSNEQKTKIKKAVLTRSNLITSIINYRKDGTEYLCQVQLFPLFSMEGELKNFLALEKELNQIT